VNSLDERGNPDFRAVKVIANPFQLFGVFFMVWISDCIQELAVSPRAADILGRTTPNCFHQARVRDARHRIGEAFNADRVFPAITEVVNVCESSDADILEDIDEAGFAGIERPITEIVVWIRHAPANVTSPDLVEMAVGPPHRGLEHQMQAIQAHCERHLDPAQDDRFDVIKLNPESGNSHGCHAARLRAS